MLNNKKTVEENNIEAESTIDMSLRLLGGMDQDEMKRLFRNGRKRKKEKAERNELRQVDEIEWLIDVHTKRNNRCNQKII